MSYSNTYCTNYLEETRVTFDNLGKHPDFVAQITDFGYDGNRIQQGAVTRTDAESVFFKLLEKRQERAARFIEVDRKYREIYSVFSGHAKRLRKELVDDPQTLASLGMDDRLARTNAEIVVQATNFYNRVINDAGLLNNIQPFGYTLEKLQGDLAEIEAYQVLRSDYERLKGECQSLVVDRDEAFKKLRAWMAAFIATCKIVFADNLQVLEEVGIFVRNRPKPKEKVEETENQTNEAEVQTPTQT
jgi:hypothetical protein